MNEPAELLALATAARAGSKKASAMIAGPSVISRKSREGGYFVVLTNDRIVKTRFFCFAQWTGSPYLSIALIKMKRAVAPPPIIQSPRFRVAASFLYRAPN